MFGIGAGEFIVILIVALIVFGPSKLPEVGRAIGKGLREFRKAQAALSATLNESDEPPKKSSPTEKISDEKKSESQAVTADDVINSAKERPLNEPPKKISESQAVTADDVINSAKERPLNEPPKKISESQAVTADDVINSAKERPLNEPPKKISESQAVTADDVINFTKEKPLNEPPKKSSHAEKISESVTADDVINLAEEKPIVKENQHEKIFNGNPNDAAFDDARAGVAGAGSSSNGIGEQPKPATDGTINSNR